MYNPSFVLSFLEIDGYHQLEFTYSSKVKKKKKSACGGLPLVTDIGKPLDAASSHVIGNGPGCVWVMLFDCNMPLDVINSHGGYGS